MQTNQQPLWMKVIFHPMLYISLLVHGAILAIPSAPPEEEVPEEEVEEEEIDLAMLPPVIEPEPEVPQPEPPPETVPPSPQQAARPTPPPQPVQQQAPAPKPVEDSEPLPDVEADPPPAPSPYSPTSDRERLRRTLSTVTDVMNAGRDRTTQVTDQTPDNNVVPPIAFKRDARNAYFTAENNGTPKPGIIGMTWLSNADEDEFLPRLRESYETLQYQFSEVQQGYGGGKLFELKTQQGDLIGYLNFAPSSTPGASTILVWWDYNPNEPAPTNDSET